MYLDLFDITDVIGMLVILDCKWCELANQYLSRHFIQAKTNENNNVQLQCTKNPITMHKSAMQPIANMADMQVVKESFEKKFTVGVECSGFSVPLHAKIIIFKLTKLIILLVSTFYSWFKQILKTSH